MARQNTKPSPIRPPARNHHGALDSLAASGAHWHVDADGVLRCKVGHKVMAEKRLSTEFIEDAEAAISIEPDQED